jgi:hypothetical protein
MTGNNCEDHPSQNLPVPAGDCLVMKIPGSDGYRINAVAAPLAASGFSAMNPAS